MSSCSWSAAPLPTRTGREPRQPSKWSRRLLGQVGGAVDPVHDLQRTGSVPAAGRRGPAARCRRPGLLDVAQAEQRVDRERAVPDPGVAVVPVALAAGLLGQPRGGRGDRRAGRRVGHELERHRRAGDHLAPAAPVGGLAAASPARSRAVSRASRSSSSGESRRGCPPSTRAPRRRSRPRAASASRAARRRRARAEPGHAAACPPGAARAASAPCRRPRTRRHPR